MGVPQLDVEIIRGDTEPSVIWQLVDDAGQPFVEASSVFVLSVTWRGGSLLRNSSTDASLVYNSAQATVTWTPSAIETAALPLGRLACYSLQRRAGTARRKFAEGFINAVGRPVP